jgi:hypothetical protein
MKSMPPPGHDVGLEPVGAEVLEDLEHGLVDHLGVGAPGLRGAPAVRASLGPSHRTRRWSCRRGSRSRSRSAPPRRPRRALRGRLEDGLERLGGPPLGVLGRQRPDAVDRERSWKYSGCSAQRQPSLSNVAMRSGSGTKSGLPGVVTRATKSEIGLAWPGVVPRIEVCRRSSRSQRQQQRRE